MFPCFLGQPGGCSALVPAAVTLFRHGLPWASCGRHGLPASHTSRLPGAAAAQPAAKGYPSKQIHP